MKIARQKEYERNEVLDLITKTFWKKGYKETSINDLIEVTGLGKRSLYSEFGNKKELFLECLMNYTQTLNKEGTQALQKKPLGLNNIKDFLDNRIQYVTSEDSYGCMVVNSVLEKEAIDLEIFQQVEKYLESTEELIYECLVAAQKNEEIKKDKDCHILASYIFTFVVGIMARSKSKQNITTLQNNVELLMEHIKI